MKRKPFLLGLATVCLSLAVAACVARSGGDADAARAHAVFAAAGAFGEAGAQRLERGMDAGALALAARFDPSPHTDFWNRPAAWTSLDLAHPPALPAAPIDQDDAALINAALPDDLAFLAPAKPFFLHASGPERDRAVLCMTQAVYYEAAFEPLDGQQAVAQVVINRMRHPDFPKSVCGVVYQGSEVPIYCQFSFACDGSLLRTPNPVYWARAYAVATAALNGFVAPQVGSATFYHADYVFPRWGLEMVKVTQLGAHIFYRFPGPAGDAQALSGHYAGGELSVSITGPPIAEIEAARAALGHGVYASAIAPMLGPSLIPPPYPLPPAVAPTPVATHVITQASPQLIAAEPAQIALARRMSPRDVVVRVHAQPPRLAAPSAPPVADEDGPIATARP